MSMNQSKCESIQESIMYLSIFYNQNSWHRLLPIAREILMEENRVSEERRAYVFFSSHKGTSIRIAFERKDDDREKLEEGLVKKLTKYVIENPSEAQPIRLPISGFFQDFPNNVIKYNLFNQRSFVEGGLSDFQLVLSKLLLAFFDDHEVDEDAIFTLMVNLNESILKGLCQNQSSKSEFNKFLCRIRYR